MPPALFLLEELHEAELLVRRRQSTPEGTVFRAHLTMGSQHTTHKQSTRRVRYLGCPRHGFLIGNGQAQRFFNFERPRG
jgi:hypothetical protein